MSRKDNETAVVKKVILAAIKAGYYLNINNGGDTYELEKPTQDVKDLMDNVRQADEDLLVFWRTQFATLHLERFAWVRFIYGNAEDGSEVIADYTTNLDEIIEPFFVDEDQPPVQKLL
jgi:hypothetical protein